MQRISVFLAISLILAARAQSVLAGVAERIYTDNCTSVVDIATYGSAGRASGGGSGFIVGDGRLIVTCGHVVEGAHRVAISFYKSTARHAADPVVTDHSAGIAVLRVHATPRRVVKLSATKAVPGMDVFSIGSPLGLGYSIAPGIVSAVRELPGDVTLIQTTVPFICCGNDGYEDGFDLNRHKFPQRMR